MRSAILRARLYRYMQRHKLTQVGAIMLSFRPEAPALSRPGREAGISIQRDGAPKARHYLVTQVPRLRRSTLPYPLPRPHGRGYLLSALRASSGPYVQSLMTLHIALRFSARRRIFDPHKNQVPIDKAAETMLESLLRGGTCMIAKVKLHYEPDVRKIPATDVNKEESFLIIRNGEKIVGRFPLSQIEHWSLDQDPDAR